MIKTAPTVQIDIYMAGDLAVASQVCREYCFAVGECVSIEPTTYIYTGGQETGFWVRFINYPRFPRTVEQLHERAYDLALKLMEACCQHSFSIVGPTETTWVSRRPGD